MDTFLPQEILVMIASQLSNKDFNFLAISSKAAHWKLDPYRRSPKVEVRITSNPDPRIVTKDLFFDVRLRTERSQRSWKSILIKSESEIESQIEDIADKIAEIYHDVQVCEPFHWEKLKFNYDLDTLAEHMCFLSCKNVTIDKMVLEYINDDQLDVITKEIKENGWKIDKLNIWDLALRKSHVDLIIACSPKSLHLKSIDDVPEGFYQLPVITQLKELNGFCDLNKVHSGSFLKLSATRLTSRGRTNITLAQVESFLEQWIESKREVDIIGLYLQFELSENAWKTMISTLDSRLVHVTQRMWGRFILERKLDGDKILFHPCLWSHLVTLKSFRCLTSDDIYGLREYL